MSTKTVLLTSALAGVFLALSGAAAFAFTPTMAVQSSVFDHPGGEITDSIDQGDKVSVGQCQYRFCFVRDLDDSDTDSGWVRQANIDFLGRTDDDDDNTMEDDSNGLVHLMFSEHHHKHN